MAIPPKYNGSIPAWYAGVLSTLGDSRNDLFFISRHWASLPAAAKTALKDEYQSVIRAGVTELQAIDVEIGNTP